MIEKTLFTALSDLGTPVYPMVIPQDVTLPAIDYYRLRTMPTNTVKGTNRSVDNGFFGIDVWSFNYLAGKELAERIIAKLDEAFGAKFLLIEHRDGDFGVDTATYHVYLEVSLREIRTEDESS